MVSRNRSKGSPMLKRSMIGIILAGVLALGWSEANASTCVSWRRVGGSNCCTAWSTGSIIFNAQFTQDCTTSGVVCGATAFASSQNLIAFCTNPSTTDGTPYIEVQCNEFVEFGGGTNACQDIHKNTTGQGHTKGTHKCLSSTEYAAAQGACQQACTDAGYGAVVDVTPVVMDTRADLFVSSEGPGFATVVPATSTTQTLSGTSHGSCPATSSDCIIEEHCTI